MPEQIQIEPKDGYLHVKVSGVFDRAKAEQFIRLILNACYQHDLSKIFIDSIEIKGEASVTESFELAELLASEQTRPVFMAILAPHELDGSFFENAAENRGVSIKVTADIEEALWWLGIKSPNKEETAPG